jgi:hypothetical protein
MLKQLSQRPSHTQPHYTISHPPLICAQSTFQFHHQATLSPSSQQKAIMIHQSTLGSPQPSQLSHISHLQFQSITLQLQSLKLPMFGAQHIAHLNHNSSISLAMNHTSHQPLLMNALSLKPKQSVYGTVQSDHMYQLSSQLKPMFQHTFKLLKPQ